LTTLKLTRSQLESALLAAANALRGPVDPADFKTYVFPVLFFKWISDNWDYQHAAAVAEWGDELTEEIEDADFQPFVIPEGCHWGDVHNTSFHIGPKLNMILQRVQQANPSLAGVFGDANWGNKERLPEPALVALLELATDVIGLPLHLLHRLRLPHDFRLAFLMQPGDHRRTRTITRRATVVASQGEG